MPGIEPIISSGMVAAISADDTFIKGRAFGAWLGLVPRQMSTEDRIVLGPSSKRGNRYLRGPRRPAGLGHAHQARQLGALRAQILDRARPEKTASQRVGDSLGQQACPDRMERSGSRPWF